MYMKNPQRHTGRQNISLQTLFQKAAWAALAAAMKEVTGN